MSTPRKGLSRVLRYVVRDEAFLDFVGHFERLIAKFLALTMIIVILVGVWDLFIYLGNEIFMPEPVGRFSRTLIELFGLFLNILIAFELLENITAYLSKQVIQVELVIVTSLIAVARKIIIFDFKQASEFDLIGLGLAIFALSISYWIVRRVGNNHESS